MDGSTTMKRSAGVDDIQEVRNSKAKRRKPDQVLTHNDYNVAWICALSTEQTAAIAILDYKHRDLPNPPSDPNTYTLGAVGMHNVVIVCPPMSQIDDNPAAAVASNVVSTFPFVKFGMMIGIGGGVSPTVQVGDVVVGMSSDQNPGVIQWDDRKTKENGIKRTGALNNPPTALLTALSKLETQHQLTGSKIPTLKLRLNLTGKYAKPSIFDTLFEADYVDEIDLDSETEALDRYLSRKKTKIAKRRLSDIHVVYGIIASGNQVIRNAASRKKINKALGGNVLCFEREAAGLMNNFPCIFIRGICVYADLQRDYVWEHEGDEIPAAAAFAKEILSVVPVQEVNQMPTIFEVLNDGQESIKTIPSDPNTVTQQQVDRDRDRQMFLDWISPIDSSSQHSDYIARRHYGTGKWLLKSKELVDWVNQSKRTLLFYGVSGAGKTTASASVIEYLHKKFALDTSVGIAYVYADLWRWYRLSAFHMRLNILKQLVAGRSSLPPAVKALYEEHTMTDQAWDSLSLKAMSYATAEYSRVFIIIDGMDQMDDRVRSQLISPIFELQSNAETSINILATTQPNPAIEAQFRNRHSEMLKIRAQDEDVEDYIHSQLSQLPIFVSKCPGLEAKIEDAIVCAVSAADGKFLFAKFHFDSLKDKVSPSQIDEALKEFEKSPFSNHKVYDQAMERLHGQPEYSRKLALNILSWIAYSKRPLRALELQHALAVTKGSSVLNMRNMIDIELIVSVCAGLIAVDQKSEIVHFVHQTINDHFQQMSRVWVLDAQRYIAETCVTYLSFTTFETGPCQTNEDFKARLQSNALYDYAAKNWGHHVHQCLHTAQTKSQGLSRDPGLNSLDGFCLPFLRTRAQVLACSQAMMPLSHSGPDHLKGYMMKGLHLAAYVGLTHCISVLVNCEMDLDPLDTDGMTPLSWAARHGHQAAVEILLSEEASPEIKDSCGRTSLWWAASGGHEAVVRLLLQHDAHTEPKGDGGRTPLIEAASKGHEVIVRLLLASNAHTESKGDNGRTALIEATSRRHEAVVRLLLENNAHTESKGDNGWTALIVAARKGHKAIVRLLLEKNASIDIKDNLGRAPLAFAIRRRDKAVIKLLRKKAAAKEDLGLPSPIP